MVEVHQQTGSTFYSIQSICSPSRLSISLKLSMDPLLLLVLLDSIEQENHIFSIECYSIGVMALELDLLLILVQKDYGVGEHLSKELQLMDSLSISQLQIQKGLELLMRIQLTTQRYSLSLSWLQVASFTTRQVLQTKPQFKT